MICKAFTGILLSICFLFHTVSVSAAKRNVSFRKNDPDGAKRKKNALKGPSIQFSPGFAYYQNRSKESIVEEIALAGYKTVHYFITNENFADSELVKAFQNKGIAVWAMVLGNGTYSTRSFPEGWDAWKVKFIAPYNFEGFTFLSPFSEAYLNWKKASLKRLLQETPFDGIEFAESYLPGSWEENTKASHGDVSPNAVLAFKKRYNRNVPEFFDAKATEYYKTDTALYKLWIDFRVAGVNNFLHELINGKDGVRIVRPDILVATWSLGIDAGPNSVELLRTHNGLDVPEMIKLVRPDIHFIQTHYPDWIKPETGLAPDYFKAYAAFFSEIRRINKKIPIGLQADIGSVRSMIKSGRWIKQFFAEAARYGYSTATAYEYQLGGYIYTERPVVLKVARSGQSRLELSFNKRIDKVSAADQLNYRFLQDGNVVRIALKQIVTDGNSVILTADQLPKGKFELEISGICDTPELRYYKGFPKNRITTQLVKVGYTTNIL